MYVATTDHGWGKGFSQMQAIAATTTHEKPDPDDTVRLWLWRVDGFEDVWPGGIKADEIHSEEYFEISGSEWNRIRSLATNFEIDVDSVLAENEADDE